MEYIQKSNKNCKLSWLAKKWIPSWRETPLHQLVTNPSPTVRARYDPPFNWMSLSSVWVNICYELTVSCVCNLGLRICVRSHNGCSVCCILKSKWLNGMIKEMKKDPWNVAGRSCILSGGRTGWHGPAGIWSTLCSSNYWRLLKLFGEKHSTYFWTQSTTALNTEKLGDHMWWEVLLEAVVFGLEIEFRLYLPEIW